MTALHSRIPVVYRVAFSVLDPVFAVAGTITAHFAPARFLLGMSPVAKYASDNQIVFDQLGATYLFMAFIQATILRETSQLKIWKRVEAGIVLCDLLHIYASCVAIGAEAFLNPLLWRSDDWINMGILFSGLAVRVAFLLGIGMAGVKDEKKRQ